jgi:hypothetical protein
MEYNLDKVWYVMNGNGGIDTLIQKDEYLVNFDTIEFIYINENNVDKILENIREYYKKNGIKEILILRLRDYIKSFFEAKELLLSRSKLMHKRLLIVGKKEYESLLKKLLKTEKVTSKEAKYISTKIEKAVNDSEHRKIARRPV